MATKKILEKDDSENTIVHIVFTSPKHTELGEFECVGALIRDEKDIVRVAFNMKNNVVEDYLDIQRADIVSIDIVYPLKIEKLQ